MACIQGKVFVRSYSKSLAFFWILATMGKSETSSGIHKHKTYVDDLRGPSTNVTNIKKVFIIQERSYSVTFTSH